MTDFAALRERMVDNQLRPSGITDVEVLAAFLEVEREQFVPPAERPFAYAERELKLTGADPRRRMMVPVELARLIHALPRGPEVKVLIVGCGAGYSAAILGRLAGSVTALEDDPDLAATARDRLAGAANVSVVSAALTGGHAAGAPYDGILVEGAVEVVPDALLEQLKPGGILATIERDERVSRGVIYERVGGDISKWPLFDAWAALLPGFERRREFVF